MFYSGIVSNSIPGTYTVVVDCNDGNSRICDFGSKGLAALGGTMDCSLPPARTEVMVYATNPKNCTFLGYMTPTSTTRTPLNAAHEVSPEGGTGAFGEAAYGSNLAFSGTTTYSNSQGNRPIDLLAGDWAKVTADGTLMSLMPYIAKVASGEASMTVSQLEGLLRHTSRWYQHFNAMGLTQTYDDHGHCTFEFSGTPYRHELEGKLGVGAPTHATELQQPGEAKGYLAPGEADYMDLTRFQTYVGALSNLFSMFVAGAPTTTGTLEDPPDRVGKLHMHIDDLGQLQLKSAQGIRIGVDGMIAYPQRVKDPQDPEGSQPSVPELGEFDKDKTMDDPALRHLSLEDRYDYDTARAYENFDTQDKDFATPDNDELLSDDPLERLRSFIDCSPEGDITLRDKWGSEIRMTGGNIILAPAKDVIQQPLGNAVTIAKDIVQSATGSVDVTADKGDVRIKAERSILQHGKGILLNSTAETTAHGFPSGDVEIDNPEAISASGIIINAPDAAIHRYARNDVYRFDSQWCHVDFRNANVGSQITYVDGSMTTLTDEIVHTISDRSITVAAPTINFIAGQSLGFIRNGDEAPVIEWVAGDENIYDDINENESIVGARTRLSADDESYLGALSIEGRKNINFYFRSSASLGTEQPLFQGSEVVGLPETWAQYLYRNDIPTAGGTPSTSPMELNAVNETYPWPGASQVASGEFYHQLVSTVNTVDGNLKRSEQKATPAGTVAVNFNKYITLQ